MHQLIEPIELRVPLKLACEATLLDLLSRLFKPNGTVDVVVISVFSTLTSSLPFIL